jgi:hypothetical protein
LLYGLAYATFIFGFVYTGKQYESALLMTSASLTALSYVAVVIAGGALLYFHAYYNATTFAALVDLPLVVARGLFNIGTGVALLNVETSRRSLFVCAGVAAIATGIGVISDGVFHTSVSDFISIALLLVGLVIFKVMG